MRELGWSYVGYAGREAAITNERMTRKAYLLSVVCLLIGGCVRSDIQTHRVKVAYPEQWALDEYRNCTLMKSADDLALLDCDRLQIDKHEIVHDTPASRMFVMDVQFSGAYKSPASGVLPQAWTCQKTKESLICRT